MKSGMKENRKTFIVIFTAYIILAATHIIMGLSLETPVVAGDEFGYLGKARYIAGGSMPVYPGGGQPSGFGYSMIISPAFMLFSDPAMIYKAALVINGILSATIVIWLFLLLHHIFKLKTNRSLLLSFVISLYPAFFLQSKMAWTDAVTPAFFALLIFSFAYFYKKQDWVSTVLFALVSVLIYTIHVRGISIIFLNFVFLIFLMRRKSLDASFGSTVLIINFFVLIFSLSYGEQLSSLMHGEQNSIEQIIEQLFGRIDLLIVIMAVLSGMFLPKKHNLHYINLSITGILSAFLLRYNSTTIMIGLALLLIQSAFVVLLTFKGKFNWKDLIKLMIFLAIFLGMTYAVIPGPDFIDFILDSLWKWVINVSGKIYYLNVATFGFFAFGIAYMVYYMATKSEMKWQELLKDPGSVALMYLILNVFGMLFIITNLGITDMDYRPDRFFYGRYAEVFLAPVFAFALYGIVDRKAFFNWKIHLAAFVIIAISVILPLSTYGNIIEAEPSFRNFMSFFPLRSALGTINIMIFTAFMLAGYLFVGFLAKKLPYIAFPAMGLVFIAFSAVTYIYVIQYHHQNRLERNIITNALRVSGVAENNLAIDLATKNSPNVFNYQYQCPELKAEFITIKNDTSDSPVLLTNNPEYNLKNNAAFLIAKEFDSDDYLWLKNSRADQGLVALAPSYLNRDLLDTSFYGILTKGMYEHRWINGSANITMPLRPNDTATALWLKVTNNNKIKQNMIVKINKEEVFNYDMRPGEWEFKIDFKMKKIPPVLNIEFFGDLQRNKKKKLIGIKVDSVQIQGKRLPKSLESLDFFPWQDYDIVLDPIFKLPEFNFSPGDTVEFNFDIFDLMRSLGNDVSLNIRLRDFATRKIIYESQPRAFTPLSVSEVEYNFVVPELGGKYFMEFDLMKEGKWLDPVSKYSRGYVIIIEN